MRKRNNNNNNDDDDDDDVDNVTHAYVAISIKKYINSIIL
jgi:hypothetical protein